MYYKEGSQERCATHIKGSLYELAMEYTVLSRRLARDYPDVIELSKVLLPEVSIREDY
ncbi:MAG: hypothetical protein IKE77_09330 [Erysipelotrichaceae bacterium]|nr:hypothetical protein [Erysipelotrichaceae bacterium]